MVRFFGGAGGAHAGGGPIFRLIIDVFADTDPVLLLQVVLEESPKSPYSCFGISSGGLGKESANVLFLRPTSLPRFINDDADLGGLVDVACTKPVGVLGGAWLMTPDEDKDIRERLDRMGSPPTASLEYLMFVYSLVLF